MFKLHYEKLNLQGDVPCFSFKKHSSMIDFIDEKCIRRGGEVVWLIAKEGLTDIFISDSQLSIQDFLEKKRCWKTPGDYFLLEYPSFEDAYEAAICIFREHPLGCSRLHF